MNSFFLGMVLSSLVEVLDDQMIVFAQFAA